MQLHFRRSCRRILVTSMSLGLAVLMTACSGTETNEPESWTQQDDEFVTGPVAEETGFEVTAFTYNNCPSGQEWDPLWGCQPTWGAYCRDTRGPSYSGLEPFCTKMPDPAPSQNCSYTRGSYYCGTEPNCFRCTPACSTTRGSAWCGDEPNCYQCDTACSVTRNNQYWCGIEPVCTACGPMCSTTRGIGWCGQEPSCYSCSQWCVDTRGSGWCGTEPNCYTCTNGGGTSEGG